MPGLIMARYFKIGISFSFFLLYSLFFFFVETDIKTVHLPNFYISK